MAGSSPKRVRKIHELVGHAFNVNCAKFGKKTTGMFFTGGEDHKAHLWRLGVDEPLATLSGHTSALECLTLDRKNEDTLIAGAASGSIKLWDLEQAKVVRTMAGHRSNCVTLDFHPFGDFFASGSADMSLKVWDTRRKDCIHTYKSHTRVVNCVKFSPDGRWVVSAGGDGVVKLWDLTAGKLMRDFSFHNGSVNALDFHPQEFLLASGSSDRTTKFWDLETFELVGSAGPETGEVQKVVFTPEGKTLLTATEESLKVWGWEPMRNWETVSMKWASLGDVTIKDGLLLGCSVNQPKSGVWALDLSKVAPFAPEPARKASSRRLSSSATSQVHPIEISPPLSLKSPPSSVEMAAREAKASPLAGRLPCLKSETCHHAGACETSRPEKTVQSQSLSLPSTPPNRPPPSPLRANFTTTTVSSRQKLAQPRLVNPSPDQQLTASAKSSSRGRRASLGPAADMSTNSREGALSPLEIPRSPPSESMTERKRSGSTIRRASIGFFSQVRVRNDGESEELPTPIAYVMALDSSVPSVSSVENSRAASEASLSNLGNAADYSGRVIGRKLDDGVSRPSRSAEPSPPLSPRKGKKGRPQGSGLNYTSSFAIGNENGGARDGDNDLKVIPEPNKLLEGRKSIEHKGVNSYTGAKSFVDIDLKLPIWPVGALQTNGSDSGRPLASSEPTIGHLRSKEKVLFSSSSSTVSRSSPIEEPGTVSKTQSAFRDSNIDERVIEGGNQSTADARDTLQNGIDQGNSSFSLPKSSGQPQVSTAGQNRVLTSAEKPVLRPMPGGFVNDAAHPSTTAVYSSGVRRVVTPESLSAGRENAANGALPLGTIPSRTSKLSKIGAQGEAKPLRLDVAAFLPKGALVVETDGEEVQNVKDDEVIEELMEQHQAMNAILQTRLTNLQAVKSFWLKDDVKGTVEKMERTADLSVVVDVLSVIVIHSGIFTLEACVVVLPLLDDLLCSKHDRYIDTGLSVLLELLKNFGSIIHDTRTAKPPPGVDIEAEKRRNRCTACYAGFQALCHHLSDLIRKGGITGKDAEKCFEAIEKL